VFVLDFEDTAEAEVGRGEIDELADAVAGGVAHWTVFYHQHQERTVKVEQGSESTREGCLVSSGRSSFYECTPQASNDHLPVKTWKPGRMEAWNTQIVLVCGTENSVVAPVWEGGNLGI